MKTIKVRLYKVHLVQEFSEMILIVCSFVMPRIEQQPDVVNHNYFRTTPHFVITDLLIITVAVIGGTKIHIGWTSFSHNICKSRIFGLGKHLTLGNLTADSYMNLLRHTVIPALI